ncbi:MAG: hypothetical protein WAT39_10395 [Planctomycetota bacterium]
MSPEVYRLLHLVAVLMLFLGFGGLLAHEPGKAPKSFLVLHGIGWLGIAVCGVGLMHKSSPPIEWQPWIYAKIAALLLLGALPTLIRRGVLTRFLALVLVLVIGAGAAWLGVAETKPF